MLNTRQASLDNLPENSIAAQPLILLVTNKMVVEDPLIKVMVDLKNKGLVSTSRILIHKRPSSHLVDFRTDRFRHRIRAFGDLSGLPERSIAFSLLHEEGHLTRRQVSGWFFAFILAIFVIIVMLALWHLLSRLPMGPLELTIYLLVFAIILISPRVFRQWLIKDEVRADSFAAELMVRAYPGITLREIADSLDTALKAPNPRKKELAEVIFFDWMGWDIHPKNEDRIRAILIRDDLQLAEK
jgi:hypothetical protein